MSAVVKESAVPVTDPYANDNGSIILPQSQVELCAAKGDVRYYLNNTFLDLSDKKRPMLVATNGHILAAAPVHIEGDITEGPIPFEAFKLVRSKKSKVATEPTMYFKGGMVGTQDQMFKRPSNDFRYPDWRKVIPEIDTSEPHDIAFNGDYMALAQKAVGASPGFGGVKVYCGEEKGRVSPSKPLLVRSMQPGCEEAVVVVMPMRG